MNMINEIIEVYKSVIGYMIEDLNMVNALILLSLLFLNVKLSFMFLDAALFLSLIIIVLIVIVIKTINEIKTRKKAKLYNDMFSRDNTTWLKRDDLNEKP